MDTRQGHEPRQVKKVAAVSGLRQPCGAVDVAGGSRRERTAALQNLPGIWIGWRSVFEGRVRG